LPGWSDHRFVLYAGRSHYQELLEAGVKIYEYQRGMLHAKTMIVDEEWVTIGSANMDRRSFLLNWEANLILVDQALADRMAQRFLLDLEHAIPIHEPAEHTPYERFRGGLCHLLSPLL
jgi:cardiolipin synthase